MTSLIWWMTKDGGGMKTDKNGTEQTLYRLGLAAILVVAAVLFLIKWFRIPLSGPLFACPIYSLTGLFCPGCGGTRALFLLARGKVLASTLCHPLVPYGLALYLLFMGSGLWQGRETPSRALQLLKKLTKSFLRVAVRFALCPVGQPAFRSRL